MSMTIHSSIKAKILEDQSEACTLTKMLKGLDKQLERKEDGGLYLAEQIWVPVYGNLRTLIMNEAYATRYSVHPGADKMYYDLRGLYWWPGMKNDIAMYKALGTRLDLSTAYHLETDGQKVGKGKLLGREIVQETTNKIIQIKERLKVTRDRQKSYADKRQKPLEFSVGDKVLLKVSPRKGVVRFGKRSKLSPRYVGPFKIVERIGPVAYWLRLPQELVGFHDTSHVSNLKKCLVDFNLHIPLDEVKVDDKLHFVEEPIEILDRGVKKLKQRWIPIVKGGKHDVSYCYALTFNFADALLLMPKFASTIKSLLANKDKLFEFAKVPLNENCSAMLLKKLPENLGDPDTYPRVPLILGSSFLRTGRALIDVYGEEITLRVNDESITFNLSQTMRYSSTYDNTSVNRVDVIDVVYEDFLQDVLDFHYNPKSSSPTLVSVDLISKSNACNVTIVKSSSPTLTPFGEIDFFFEEIKDFLNDDSISTGIKNFVYDPEGDIFFLEKLLNEDPFHRPLMDLKVAEESKEKSFIEEPLELELKKVPSHLEYAFLEDSNKLPVIIAKNLKVDEREALINVLKSYKWAISWKFFDIKGIDPRFYTHKILMEHDYTPAVQSQRRVNPKIHDVIKKEVIKLLDVGMIYPIFDSPWVSLIHCVPKKGGMTVVTNENNELIPMRLVTRQRVCIDYRKLNAATRKDYFPLPFMDQMLERAKVDVIAKLPHPTTVKGVRSFLGHAGFYRRFIQDFSKIARPMTRLLEKETPFVFSKECIEAFNSLKKKLTKAPILVVPAWNLPFELMCDASDYAIGAALGQHKSKHFQPIHYASKTMTEAQIHYTTTEKEMLAVVYAFEKFWPYLVLSKSIVYTDHSALKYLLNKQNAKLRKLLKSSKLSMRDLPGPSWCQSHSEESREKYLREMRCLIIVSKFVRYLIFVVLLFNSRLKIFYRKLKTRWSGPFTITHVFPYGTIELSPYGLNFKVNGHRVKHYFGGDIPSNVTPDLHTFPMDN
nr:reverse transcriptase domain-containing protein [Tanacetum cinerariifolium]